MAASWLSVTGSGHQNQKALQAGSSAPPRAARAAGINISGVENESIYISIRNARNNNARTAHCRASKYRGSASKRHHHARSNAARTRARIA